MWQEKRPTQLVWISLLQLSERGGSVLLSVDELSTYAGVSVRACEAALHRLTGQRRITPSVGGWQVLR